MSVSTTISTYAELDRWVSAFTRPDGMRLIFLAGDPGLSKSYSIRGGLTPRTQYIKCARLTGYRLFKMLYLHRNKALILDDIDYILRHPESARLLMALCETDDDARLLAWYGKEQMTVKKGKKTVPVPDEFRTRSRVMIVCNDFNILASRFQALLDRGVVVFFTPHNEEIHAFVGKWFKDREIYEWIEDCLDWIPRHSIRFYTHALEMKLRGLDWAKALIESWTQDEADDVDSEKVVEMLLLDPRYKSDIERIEAFEQQAGRKRRQWYNLKKKVSRRLDTLRKRESAFSVYEPEVV